MIRLSRAQVREIDRRAIEQYQIPGIVLMENAARAVADVATRMLKSVPAPSVEIICGGGNNGGDGLAVARHLHNHGLDVEIALAVNPEQYRGDALINWRIVEAMRLPTVPVEDANIPVDGGVVDLVIDALFGTGLTAPPREPQWIELMNSSGLPILAIDVPSGLDCDTGKPLGACVEATMTITFVAEKIGFTNPDARKYLGEVIVGDIGCPIELIDAVLHDLPHENRGHS
jgi:NAD(P)H-hydrate epimerase